MAFLIVLGFCFGAAHNATAADRVEDGPDRAAVDAIYADLGGRPIWWTRATGLTARGKMFVTLLSHADKEGLRPSDYLPANKGHSETRAAEKTQASYDRRLTEGLLRYISDMRDGRLDGRYADPELFDIPRPTDAAASLKAGLRTADFGGWLAGLPPQSTNYKNLKGHLARYRNLTYLTWPRLRTDKNLEPGSAGPDVRDVRVRLRILGDFPADADTANDAFDETLLAAVLRFQARHGLTPDGIVGPQTYAALNVSPAAITDRIIVNLERLRRLPENPGSRYILVNVAGFELTAVSGGVEILRMPVIVGRKKRRTPVLKDKITNIIFRPTWTVPVKIAREDLLPKIKADAGYLAAADFRVFRSWRKGAPELDPGAVDWQAISPERLSYKFRQDPGAKNALGLIRFTLTNPHGIYLHDTPNKNLFVKPGRAFSSGCIRAADVVALANFVLEPLREWTPESIREAMNASETQVVKLPVPIPFHIIYSTAAADDAGQLHLRRDIYGRDAVMIRALGLGAGG